MSVRSARNTASEFHILKPSRHFAKCIGDGLANALLGNVSSYTQWNETTTFNFVYQNYEEYFQDNWKVNRRLTLDLGVRFYHQSPQEDNNFTNENFFPSLYSKSAQARLYTPFCSNGAATCTAIFAGSGRGSAAGRRSSAT